MNIYPYVYRLDHPVTGEFYIGFRSANKAPAHLDLGIEYKTSSKSVKPRFAEFTCTIVAEFFNGTDAYDFEQELIHESWGLPGMMNKVCRYGNQTRFSTAGVPATGKNAKGMPATGKNAKGTSVASRGRMGVPKTGKRAKGEPATGKRAKGEPATGKAAKGVPKTGKRAKGIPRPKHECTHCGTWMSACNLARWHGDNCKLR